MIGVFDSGYGGLVILRELVRELPEYSYVYSGDNVRAPYGPRSQEEIFAFTLKGVEFLLSQGCDLVILGCNTASSVALRRIQQEILPTRYPDKRVLGILVPTVEQLSHADEVKNVAVFATEATVSSHAYKKEVANLNPMISVTEYACPRISPLVEADASVETIRAAVQDCVAMIASPVDAVLLGCTHYALIADLFVEALPMGTTVYDQGHITARSLRDYLSRHPEIESVLDQHGARSFFTSGNPEEVSRLGTRFFGAPAVYQHIELA